ncbi:MAG: hypothetical protein QNJ47_00435 [Nostocaceae cyanobacterium]|nr:hypothetical protein [Nostocaceae cyanobacterium]
MLRCLSLTITTTATLWLLCSSLTLAKTKKPKLPDKFPPNPLEITTPDPLLPNLPEKQPLTPTQRQTLEIELDKLNQQAAAKLEAGDKQGAFDTWNREIRLRRFLSPISEVQALSRVGAIAYNQNERLQVQYINQRLQTIEEQIKSQQTPDLELWQAIAVAYTQVRSPKPALAIYQQVLAAVREQKDTVREVETLQNMGALHLSWFDYSQAGITYEELLKLATNQGDFPAQVTYLQQLAYIYQQAKQPQKSIKIRNQLVKIYQQENNLTAIPALKLAIGSDYESLARENPSILEEAFNNYQDAYITAWQSQQYVRASEALRKLIALYRSNGQIEDALQVSQILLQTEELARNFYGLMTAYDQIGQIHLERNNYSQALAAFQKGLEFAQQLKHDETYFTGQIEKVSGQISN